MEVEKAQTPVPQAEIISIRSYYNQCISSFTQLHNCLEYLNQGPGKQLFPIIGLSTELGRLRVWAGNTGAHQTGVFSLDHRLREVPDIHVEISELLMELNSDLGEIFDLTGYSTSMTLNQWEYPIESDSPEAPSDVIGSLQADNFRDLVNDISHIITCLYKLFIAIRNPVPQNRQQKLASIDVSHFESKDIKHLLKNFPLAPNYVLERLRKGNTKRRQLLRYYQLYHDKLARFVDLPPQDDVKPTSSIQLENHDELADTCPAPPQGPDTAPTALKPQETPSTIIPKNVQPEIHQGGSADIRSPTSCATLTPANPTSAHVPPPPNLNAAYYNGQSFECPYCFTLITFDTMHSWKKHVYRDLRPYACMHKKCQSWDILYESQHEWYDHELSVHLREWYCGNCLELFDGAPEFKEHLLTIHMEMVKTEGISVEEIVELCGRARAPPEACPFCGEAVAQDMRRKHLARHMKGFALLALPKVGDEDEELQEKEQTGGAQDTDTDAHLQAKAPGLGRDLKQANDENPPSHCSSNEIGQ